MGTKIYLETGAKKVFAVSLRWPGWARSGKNEEAAIEAFSEYAPRYAIVAEAAGQRFPARVTPVERVTGDATTDFGAISKNGPGDDEPFTPAEAERQISLMTAAWKLFDEASATSPEELRKGPRGGGRDRDKMIGHLLDSEAAYARKLGVKHKPPAVGDADAIGALRDEITEAVRNNESNGWTARYAVRRITWHVLDHLWEMHDRAA
jgi:hypothetical protein